MSILCHGLIVASCRSRIVRVTTEVYFCLDERVTCTVNSFSADVDRSRHKGLSAVVDKSRHLGVSAVTCSSHRQKSPVQNDSQIVKYKNIFSTGQEVKKLFSTIRVNETVYSTGHDLRMSFKVTDSVFLHYIARTLIHWLPVAARIEFKIIMYASAPVIEQYCTSIHFQRAASQSLQRLVSFLRYSMSNNGVPLKSGLRIIQCH